MATLNLGSESVDSLSGWVSEYRDTPEFNAHILNSFRRRCFEIEHLRRHREYIEDHNRRGIQMGHGDRCVQYLFKLLVDEMPRSFRFLEIGVFKGQICSLIQLLASVTERASTIVGVTPLYDPELHMGQGYAKYNRLPFIEQIYRDLGLTMDNTQIIDGLSQNPEIIKQAAEKAPFDIVYIDGDHSYDATVSDIVIYGQLLRPGGFLVVDDASNFKNLPKVPDPVHQAPVLWAGYEEVSQAVRDYLESNPEYKELLTCMHLRLFQKLERHP